LETNRGVTVDSSTVCQTLWRHGFTLRRNAFFAKEHVGEDGVRYRTEVSQNHRPDRLILVDGFAMDRLTTRWYLHMRSLCGSRIPTKRKPTAVTSPSRASIQSGRRNIRFCRPTFHVPMVLWLFHISCTFHRRNPAQLGSLDNRLRDVMNFFPILNAMQPLAVLCTAGRVYRLTLRPLPDQTSPIKLQAAVNIV